MSVHSEEDGDRLESLSLFFMGVATLPGRDGGRNSTTVPLTTTTYDPSHQSLCAAEQRVDWEKTRPLQKAMSEHVAVMTRHRLPGFYRKINISVEDPASPWETPVGKNCMVVELCGDAVEDSVRVSVDAAPMSNLPPTSEDGDESNNPSVSPGDDRPLYIHLAPDPTSRLWMSQGGPGFCNNTVAIGGSFSGNVVLMPPPTSIDAGGAKAHPIGSDNPAGDAVVPDNRPSATGGPRRRQSSISGAEHDARAYLSSSSEDSDPETGGHGVPPFTFDLGEDGPDSQRLYLPPPAYVVNSEPSAGGLGWSEPADRAESVGRLGLADALRQAIQHVVAHTNIHRYYSVVVAQDYHRARRGLLGVIRQVVLCTNPIPPPYCVLNIDASGLDVTIFRSAEAMMNLCAVTTTSIPAGVVYRHFPMPVSGAGDDGNPRTASEFTDLTDARYVVHAAFDHIRAQLDQ